MDRLIVVLVVVLAVIAIAQLLRVYELASALKGKREEIIPEKDNHLNANLMIVFMVAFYAFFIWLTYNYAGNNFGKGPSASNVAEDGRWLLNINWAIIVTVFFLTNTLLFVFAWKYYYREGRKAHWFPHSNKLEMIWTIVPSIVLAVIIILGLKTWFNVMGADANTVDTSKPVAEQAQVVEITAEQFGFTTRYAGHDNKLGQSDYKLIGGDNAVGVITTDYIEDALGRFDEKIDTAEVQIKRGGHYLPDWKVDELEDQIIKFNRLKRRLIALRSEIAKDTIDWDALAGDDILAGGELYLVKGRDYNFTFRSKDVIHSAYFPHFDAQMNMVPGATNYFSFTPTMTTEEMREAMEDPNFDFVLVCNKICGGGHYGMKAKIIVGTEEGFREWLVGKTTIDGRGFSDNKADWKYEEGQVIIPMPIAKEEGKEEGADAETAAM